MGADEVNAFLTHLATEGNVSASTQAQALSALLFLYRHVLSDRLPWLDDIVRARKPKRFWTRRCEDDDDLHACPEPVRGSGVRSPLETR
jgi:hypothetical protein